MKKSSVVWTLTCVFLLFGLVSKGQAKDLADQLDGLFGPNGLILTPTIPSHQAHFNSVSAATLGLLTQQLAPSAADFPAISTTPGFTFRYDSQIQSFVRSSESLGSVYVERAQTLGQGKFDIGFSYLYVDFDELNGKDLDGLSFRLQHNDCCQPRFEPPMPHDPAFENDFIDLTFQKFSLRSHVMSFFATYGITDRWDVNILLPVVYTSFKVKAHAHINNVGSKGEFPGFPDGIHFFDPSGRIDDYRTIDDDKTGVGDLQLRTKYHLFERGKFNAGMGLALRLPTGSEGNFQGLGDTTLTPFLALSQEYDRFDFHANGGIQINTDDTDRSRVRYAGGVTVKIIEQIALLVDVIGSSSLQSVKLSRTVQDSITEGTFPDITITEVPRTFSRNFHTDQVDLNVGFKTSPFGTERAVVGFATVFIPLNDDGLRSDAVPAVGLQVGF